MSFEKVGEVGIITQITSSPGLDMTHEQAEELALDVLEAFGFKCRHASDVAFEYHRNRAAKFIQASFEKAQQAAAPGKAAPQFVEKSPPPSVAKRQQHHGPSEPTIWPDHVAEPLGTFSIRDVPVTPVSSLHVTEPDGITRTLGKPPKQDDAPPGPAVWHAEELDEMPLAPLERGQVLSDDWVNDLYGCASFSTDCVYRILESHENLRLMLAWWRYRHANLRKQLARLGSDPDAEEAPA